MNGFPTTPPSRAGRDLVALGAYLVSIVAMVRLGTSLYLPALPRIGADLGLSPRQLSSTLSIYLAAFSLFSLFLGPLSDRWGRRVLMRGGIAAFLAGSAFCAFSHGFGMLLSGRLFQALGGAAVQVGTRAIARDAFDDRQMLGVMGWIGAITGMIPVLAPFLGGLITQGFGWRANFFLLVLSTLAVGSVARRYNTETLPAKKRISLGIGATLHSYASMIVAPSFILPMVPLMLCFAAQGAYLVGAPFIFVHVLGLSPAAFGTTSLVPVAALFSGRSLCLAAQKRGSLPAAFSAGAAIAFLGGLLLVAVHRLGWVSPVPILLSCGVFCLGFGILLPIAMKAGLSAFPNRVGTSSALFGCLNLAASAVGSAGVGGALVQGPRDVSTLANFTLAVTLAGLLVAPFAARALAAEHRRP